ncbi:MAG: NUDIX domain-containing protein [Oscillatoriophycideae cyanobacterium NC_groundwater_1537_Pr4_S-0.65um_50_18]|nr:NUDIX domain-containing protein [Oscillatoriophycideae cyanobacterium NC_groundwater_1537_Pr4_S-0.65um_50_18]
MTDPSSKDWQTRDRFLELHSHWLTLIGEHLQDDRGNLLEYWRIEKADSVIVLPIQSAGPASAQEACILLPSPSYRPGIGQVTLDFPGGRVPADQTPQQAAIATLKRELGIEAANISPLMPLNTEGWVVNSSFSNQKLYGFVAYIQDSSDLNPNAIAATYPISTRGVHHLLQDLNCLQCRAVLLEWTILNLPLQPR